MTTRNISSSLSTAGLACLIVVLAGCSQNKSGMSQVPATPPPPGNIMTTEDGQTATANQYQSNLSQGGNSATVTGNKEYPQTQDLQDPDRNVSVRAPLVNLDINRDSGSVHLNTPFVRINTFGKGHGAQIDIPRLRTDSEQAQPANLPSASDYPSR
jgi:hypothetical protein